MQEHTVACSAPMPAHSGRVASRDFLLRKNQIAAPTIIVAPTTPPTTPPAIAAVLGPLPLSELEPECVGDNGSNDDSVVGVGCWEVAVGVGDGEVLVPGGVVLRIGVALAAGSAVTTAS
jgi:hypothetical protein